METLTKADFWDVMEQKYPKAMKHFNEWIDKYKKDIDWDILFGWDGANEDSIPKYHELPIAMQFGIFYFFMNECTIIDFVTPTYPSAIIENGLKKVNTAILIAEMKAAMKKK